LIAKGVLVQGVLFFTCSRPSGEKFEMKFSKWVAGSLIGAGMIASPSAFAAFTGNVGAFSEYVFRGVSQGSGAAVQGGLDYSHDSGFYVGTWASTIGFGGASGGTEVDGYGGFAGKIGDVGFDIGGIFYWYSEEDEVDAKLNTLEVYGGLSFGPVALKYYYADEANFFIGDDDAKEAGYLLGTLALPINDTINFTASVGMYSGDEIERYLQTFDPGTSEDTYIDYSIGLAKTLDGGMTFTLQLIDTDINEGDFDDDPQVVVGFKKSFEM